MERLGSYSFSVRGTSGEVTKKESTMKLKKPISVSSVDEKRYLTHCKNIARIVSTENGSLRDRIKLYFSVTGAEVVDD